MRAGIRVVLCLGLSGFLAARATAQSRAYTNADLGKPLTYTHTLEPDELAWLLAHAYVYVPIDDGPTAVVLGSSPNDGPYGPLLSTPVESPSMPWMSVAYGWPGRYYGFARARGPAGAAEHSQAPFVSSAAPPVPDARTRGFVPSLGAGAAGVRVSRPVARPRRP